MKKLIFACAILVLTVGKVHAQAQPAETTGVTQQFASTMTCVAVNVSSSAPTAMLANTQKLWRSITVQNQAGSANLYCGENANLTARSGSTFAATIGFQIVSGASASFALVPGMQFYCKNDSGSASTISVVCKGH